LYLVAAVAYGNGAAAIKKIKTLLKDYEKVSSISEKMPFDNDKSGKQSIREEAKPARVYSC
jgi:hypothetical protein